ncbi:hypothetical protein [Saccharopolyspora gregorii]|uniref:Uncharacterized protein n=1 Tax=Saccharopolyspora gregorii TaxID=33914 RepID=A0ABP6RRY6_9PSEU
MDEINEGSPAVFGPPILVRVDTAVIATGIGSETTSDPDEPAED